MGLPALFAWYPSWNARTWGLMEAPEDLDSLHLRKIIFVYTSKIKTRTLSHSPCPPQINKQTNKTKPKPKCLATVWGFFGGWGVLGFFFF